MYTNIFAVFLNKCRGGGGIPETEGGGKCLERHTYTTCKVVANVRKNWKIVCGY